MSLAGPYRTNQPRLRLSAIGLTTDKGQPGGRVACPLMTQQRHHVLLSLVPQASETSGWPFNTAAAASQAGAAARPVAYLS
jgi:hypothetical protein